MLSDYYTDIQKKKKVKYKSEPNTKAMYSTKMNTQILSSVKSAVIIKSRPTAVPKQ